VIVYEILGNIMQCIQQSAVYHYVFYSDFSVKQLTSNTLVSGDGIKLSLKCPVLLRRIRLPARGRDCHHLQVSDEFTDRLT
jgi:hypothetical protein